MEMKKELTKKQKDIIEATVGILQEEGLERVTMKRIARRIGVTDGALYNHFTSKKEIFNAIHSYLKGVYLQVMEAVQADESESVDFLEKLIILYRDHFFSDPRLAYLIRNYSFLFKNYPALMKDMRQVRRSFFQLFREKVEAGIRRGDLPEEAEAESLMYIINGAFLALYMDLMMEDQIKKMEQKTDALWEQLKILLRL